MHFIAFDTTSADNDEANFFRAKNSNFFGEVDETFNSSFDGFEGQGSWDLLAAYGAIF